MDDLYITIKKETNSSIKIHPEKNEPTDMNQSFSVDSSLLTLEERIDNLPEDLKRKIYIDYFGSIYIFNKFINERLNMIESVQLNYCKIINIMPFIINNNTIVEYLLENNNEFRLTHNDHINGKQNFKLMNWTESFALSILYYTYH